MYMWYMYVYTYTCMYVLHYTCVYMCTTCTHVCIRFIRVLYTCTMYYMYTQLQFNKLYIIMQYMWPHIYIRFGGE